jgi:hypothetical protein
VRVVGPPAHLDPEGQQTIGLKPRIALLQAPEALHHEAGADHQHDGKGDLGHHQRVAQAMVPGATR